MSRWVGWDSIEIDVACSIRLAWMAARFFPIRFGFAWPHCFGSP